MENSYFFIDPEINRTDLNSTFINLISSYSSSRCQQAYILKNPLGDNKYRYDYNDALVLLIPKHKIVFINFSPEKQSEFEDYYEDFLEDIGSISDKYRYRDKIGRPRAWKKTLTSFQDHLPLIHEDLDNFLGNIYLTDETEQRQCELIISLLTGSINDIDNVSINVPETLLDKVKNKIVLFDGDQTRFIYSKGDSEKKIIRIQGLSGTGKTELLLHKLKEIYINDSKSNIMFTCHNKILASNIRKRIPEFFTFMKVEEQIDHNRLRCVHAWGSQFDSNSGAYRYICSFYNIPFLRFNWSITFDYVCKMALKEIEQIANTQDFEFAFDYMLIDEGQDFTESFIELCQKVTKNQIYVAGDIFQSIFDENLSQSVNSDYLLSKCYRTDPRTLMFAHGLGMGLFETKKIRWLEDDELEACGYISEDIDQNNISLTRYPIRRFEDISDDEVSMEMIKADESIFSNESGVIGIISDIRKHNPTVLPDDIAIIFLDSDKSIYENANILELNIFDHFSWEVNKAYESKVKVKNKIFISNSNNVKGLEFPFVICIGKKLSRGRRFRNSLYTMLTRSFIRSYLVLTEENDDELLTTLSQKLKEINSTGAISIEKPTEEEKEKLKTTFSKTQNISYHDFVINIMEDCDVPLEERESVFESINAMLKVGNQKYVWDEDKIKQIIDLTLDLQD